MSKPATDWHGVALSKLCKILGDAEGQRLMNEVMQSAGLTALQSADDLKTFADQLKPRGGLLGATGGLLSLHAVIHSVRSGRGSAEHA